MEKREIELCGERIIYTLERKKVKNINMRVRPQFGIQVSASPEISIDQIEQALQQHGSKLLHALWDLELEQPMIQQYPMTYSTGETVLYLGKFYILKVERATKDAVQKQDDILFLLVRHPENAASRKRVFDRWWKAACERVIWNMCRAVYPIFEQYGFQFPEIRFRQMISMWGNCRPQRKIVTFNYRLLAAEPICIEYVVIHEFTHFLYPNHSKAFYAFLEKEIPDWKHVQKKLQKTVGIT